MGQHGCDLPHSPHAHGGRRLDDGHDVGPAGHELHRELQVERPIAGNQHASAG